MGSFCSEDVNSDRIAVVSVSLSRFLDDAIHRLNLCLVQAYSLIDKEVGYCQGSAFIVGLLLMHLPEEEAFAVFVTLMQEFKLRELFKPSMAELGLCMFQLENMLQVCLNCNIYMPPQRFSTFQTSAGFKVIYICQDFWKYFMDVSDVMLFPVKSSNLFAFPRWLNA